MEQEQGGPSLDKILKGKKEKLLVDLILYTKFDYGFIWRVHNAVFNSKDDFDYIFRVYNDVGSTFLDNVLRIGMGKGITTERSYDFQYQYTYLLISFMIIDAFCRVPNIASSDDMVKKIPLILEVLSEESSLVEECFEFIYLVSAAHKDGSRVFYESGGMTILALQMSNMLDGSHTMALAMKLLQLIASQVSLDTITKEYCLELSSVVIVLAKLFALSRNELKFEALHLLLMILSSIYAAPVHETLRTMSNTSWTSYVRVGVVAVFQNIYAPNQWLEAVILAESVMCIAGEAWLIRQTNLPYTDDSIPADSSSQ